MKSRNLFVTLASSVCIVAMATPAQAQTREYRIPAGSLKSALDAYARQSGRQIIYKADEIRSRRSGGVSGNLSADAALTALLTGSGFSFRADSSGAVAIISGEANAGSAAAEGGSAEIVVTGSRIRGATIASPTITIGQKQFKEEGFNDLGEVVRSIPENFRGGQNPGVTRGANAGNPANANLTGGSALNLRGLGPDATLTLLNGRRLSYDGSFQAVDISAIPIEAVQRLEIVPDGGSAIYGSDAVGGVANVILKRDFNGLTVGSLYGEASEGGLNRVDITATAGSAWKSGGVLATYLHSHQDAIFATQRTYTDSMPDPTSIYPKSTVDSALVSFHQSIGSSIEVRVDALRTQRDFTFYNGSTSSYIFYPSKTTSTLVAPSLTVNAPFDWKVSVGASFGDDKGLSKSYSVTSSATTLTSDICRCNSTRTWGIDAEGPVLRIGQRDIRLAIGAGERSNNFEFNSYSAGTVIGGRQRSKFAYGELFIPIIGTDNSIPAIRRLEFTAAARSEDYDEFGTVTTPKIGLVYDPTADFSLKATWGRSFKAPSLAQVYGDRQAYLITAAQAGCSSCAAGSTVLVSYGGNPDLKAERARTWSATLNVHPRAIAGLNINATYFDVDFTQRIVQPLPSIFGFIGNGLYSQYVTTNPSLNQIQSVMALYGGAFFNITGLAYDPAKVVAIAADQFTNVAQHTAQGVDLNGAYQFSLAGGQMEFRGGMSWLKLKRKNSPGDVEYQLSGTINFPASYNSRLGASWSKDGLSLAAFGNHTSGVVSNLTGTEEKISSFTTFDATIRYEIPADKGLMSGLAISLSADNIFDKAPPLYTPTSINNPPYDSSNYSAIGRYITLSISKKIF